MRCEVLIVREISKKLRIATVRVFAEGEAVDSSGDLVGEVPMVPGCVCKPGDRVPLKVTPRVYQGRLEVSVGLA